MKQAENFTKKTAGDNPWHLPGLEWRTSSPPSTFNFEKTPVATWEAYDYSETNGLSGVTEERRKSEQVVSES